MNQESMRKLKQYCLSYDINITDDNLKQFDLYGDFLKDYNQKVNLTAIVEDEDIVKKHFLDSVIISKYIDLKHKKVIDIGSGAGFPGVPLKIISHEMDLTLVDSVNKKVEFLKLLKNHLKLEYQVINQRAEDLTRLSKKNNIQNNIYREKYDIVIARAVKNLKQLSEYCLPFVKPNGFFVAMKGVSEIDKEIDDAKEMINILGGQIVDKIKYKLISEDSRMLIVIKKISHTPPKYPRLTAQILKLI